MNRDDHRHRLPLAANGASGPVGTAVATAEIISVPARFDSSAAVIPGAAGAGGGAGSSGTDELDLLQVGDLARLSGKTVRAIHLYEELGLLRPHARSKGRYRLFGRDAVMRVRWIGKLHDLGLSLTHIQTVVREWETSPSAPGAMAKMREVYAQKLASTRAQIKRLAALEEELAESLKYLETCDVCDPVRLLSACTCCDLHCDDNTAPELVAGFHIT